MTVAAFPMACVVNPFDRPQRAAPPGILGSTLLRVAAEVTGVPVKVLIGHDKRREVAIPRQFAYWLIRRRAGLSAGQIGHLVDRADVTVKWGLRATNRRLAEEWPMVIAWRDRAAVIVSRIDMEARRQQEHKVEDEPLFASCTG